MLIPHLVAGMGADSTATKIWASCVCRYSCNNCSCWNLTNIKCFRGICTTVILTNNNLSQCRRTIPTSKFRCINQNWTDTFVVTKQNENPLHYYTHKFIFLLKTKSKSILKCFIVLSICLLVNVVFLWTSLFHPYFEKINSWI